MLDFLFSFFWNLDTSPLGIIWIALLIDCVINRKLSAGQKAGWFAFIFFTHLIGAVFYFFFGPAMIQRFLFGWMDQSNPSLHSTAKAEDDSVPVEEKSKQADNDNETYPHQQSQKNQDYEWGYRAHQANVPNAPPVAPYYDSTYEQPEATYPEMVQDQDRNR